MSQRFLTALPVYNEAAHVRPVLEEVLRFSEHVLVVDDGSTDHTARELAAFPQVQVVRHPQNRGYGAALLTAFDYSLRQGYDALVTIDCDGQHEPQLIPSFVDELERADADIVSGSRYLRRLSGDSQPPEDRRRINRQVTAELNRRLCLELTDAFCGFKAYRVPALAKLRLTEVGYAMPLELWVEAARVGLRVVELPVPLIYLDEARSFGGALDTAEVRREYYHLVLDRSMALRAADFPQGNVWAGTMCGEGAE